MRARAGLGWYCTLNASGNVRHALKRAVVGFTCVATTAAGMDQVYHVVVVLSGDLTRP